MSLNSVSPKKFSYTLNELWELSAFDPKRWHEYLSPIALGILLSGIPLQIRNPVFSGLILGILIVISFWRVFIFTRVLFTSRFLGNLFEIEFTNREITQTKLDGSSLIIPYRSLKTFRIKDNLIIFSTNKSGLSLPKRLLTPKEVEILAKYAEKNLYEIKKVNLLVKIGVTILTFILASTSLIIAALFNIILVNLLG